MKKILNDLIRDSQSICITAHTNPDGDAVGSALAVYNYIYCLSEAEGLSEKEVTVYMELKPHGFEYLKGFYEICDTEIKRNRYDLCVVLDCAEEGRMGRYRDLLGVSSESLMIDHHYTNTGFGNHFQVNGDASSASEMVFELLEEAYINTDVALCIYTGIAHDTGIFRYSSTSGRTMQIAGFCMEKGIDFPKIIDNFYEMTFRQKKCLARVLERMQTFYSGRVVVSYVDQKTMEEIGIEATEMDGMVDNIRSTEGSIIAIFLYQTPSRQYKVSLRSRLPEYNVAEIAKLHNGGGHVMAAGCMMSDNVEKNIKILREELEPYFSEN